MNTKTIIKLVVIVLICVALFFGYRYFFGQTTEVVGVTTVGANGQPISDQPVTDYESQQFLTLLASVKDVGTRLREDFVRDPFFLLLKDYTVPVTPKPISRSNPFLPIGFGGPYVAGAKTPVETVIATTTPVIASSTTASSTPKKTTSKASPNPTPALDGSF